MYRIAVCDDEAVSRRTVIDIIKEVLPEKMIEIREYADGSDLLYDVEENEHFDIIMLDISMENMDGMTVAANIRSNRKNSTTPMSLNTRANSRLHTASMSHIHRPTAFMFILFITTSTFNAFLRHINRFLAHPLQVEQRNEGNQHKHQQSYEVITRIIQVHSI